MNYKQTLHELIDSLDENTCKKIYHLILGLLGGGGLVLPRLIMRFI